MKEPLVKKSLSNIKDNLLTYIAVGVFCGLFVILAATLSFVDIVLFLLAVPFIVLPFVFASMVSCYFLHEERTVTVSSMFRYSLAFYSPQFRSSFRGIKSFLLSLAIYGGSMIVTYVICYLIFKGMHGSLFTDSFSNLLEVYSTTDLTYEELIGCLNENDGLLLTFFTYVSTLPIPFAVIWFLYSTSFNSLTVYYRIKIKPSAFPLMRDAINFTYSKYKNNIRADWFKLNWPLLALSLLGSIGAALIAFFVFSNSLYFSAIITLGSVILLLFFFPFYLSNMEVLYDKYANSFSEGNQIAVGIILNKIKNSFDLSEEDKKDLENSFKENNEEEE